MNYNLQLDGLEMSLVRLGLQHLIVATRLATERGQQPAGEQRLRQIQTTRDRIFAQEMGQDAARPQEPRQNPYVVGTDLWGYWQRAHDRAQRTHARAQRASQGVAP